MKKLWILLIVILLAGCKPVEEDTVNEFVFNGETYVYSDTTSTGYDLFNGNGHLIEIMCETECLLSFELDEDIYIVNGTSDSYEITKNGTIILIDGKDQTPTGTELPDWNEDLVRILEAYKK